MSEQTRAEACEEHLDALRGTMSEGQPFFRDLEEGELNRRLQRQIVLYRESGDGRFIWRILLLHEAKRPIPPEVFDKLAEWGGRLLAAKSPDAIAAAMEFGGDEKRHIGPGRSASVRHRLEVASEVRNLIALHARVGRKVATGEAIRTVARRRGMSESHVKKLYHDTFRVPKPAERF